jgi:hypothetical protein
MALISGSAQISFKPAGVANYYDNFNSYSAAALAGQGSWLAHLNEIVLSAGNDGMEISSNTSGVVCSARFNKTLNADQWAEITVTAVGSSNDAIGVGVHLTGSGSTACGYGYYCMYGTQRLWYMVNGVKTNIGSTGTAAMAVGDVLRLEVKNGVLYAYRNGVLDTGVGSNGTATISSYGNYTTGVAGVTGYTSAATYGDFFRCGNITSLKSPIAGVTTFSTFVQATISNVATSTSPITGTATLAITSGGTIVGRGAIAGTIIQTYTLAGNLTGRGTVQGTASFVTSSTGSINGRGMISGGLILAISTVGLLKGLGAIQGDVGLIITPAGSVKGRGPLAGSSTLIISPAAAITNNNSGTSQIAGTISLGFTPASAIKGYGAISGGISIRVVAVSVIRGRAAIMGSVTLGLDPEAAIENIASPIYQIQGTTSLGMVAQGMIKGHGIISGDSLLLLLSAGALARFIVLKGTTVQIKVNGTVQIKGISNSLIHNKVKGVLVESQSK